MANKFLGLDSINVLKKYIDEQLAAANINTRVITIQAYAYYKDGETVIAPSGGGFDTEAIAVEYPNGWYSLKYVLDSLNDEETGETVDTALANGSIWMSIGVVEGSKIIEWSAPMKVSGQNGISVRFQYSHNANADEQQRTENPKGVDSDNRVEYVWTKTGDNNWEGPAIWAMYAKDAREILWRWKVTGEDDIDEGGKPIKPNKPQAGETGWMSNIATTPLSQDMPYMWMSYQIVPAGGKETDDNWTEPILFGHWGRDGAVPDYTVTLYHIGLNKPEVTNTHGIVAPDKPEFEEGKEIKYYIKDGWVELPEDTEVLPDEEANQAIIWWQCTFKVNGRTNKVVKPEDIGAVKRYNAVDGTAKPGQFTLNLYAWSENQECPEMIMDEDPETGDIISWKPINYNYLPDKPMDDNGVIEKYNHPEASLWMITANVQGLNEKGEPVVNGSWSEPVKLTGPRGPIAYDYRMEQRYYIGTEQEPKDSPEDAEWTIEAPVIDETSPYQYIWVKNFLVCYKMKYGTPDPITGEYPVVQDKTKKGEIVESYNYYRLTGKNGQDGNRKNSIVYSSNGNETKEITSFSLQNLYISDNAINTEVTYQINLDYSAFINGYTGKFSNIGKGTVKLSAGTGYTFKGSNTTKTSITLNPQETVELVCYNLNNNKYFLVIGKDISE